MSREPWHLRYGPWSRSLHIVAMSYMVIHQCIMLQTNRRTNCIPKISSPLRGGGLQMITDGLELVHPYSVKWGNLMVSSRSFCVNVPTPLQPTSELLPTANTNALQRMAEPFVVLLYFLLLYFSVYTVDWPWVWNWFVQLWVPRRLLLSMVVVVIIKRGIQNTSL